MQNPLNVLIGNTKSQIIYCLEEKPLTFSQLVEYTEKSLIPLMEEKFVTKGEFSEFKSRVYRDLDSLITKVDKKNFLLY